MELTLELQGSTQVRVTCDTQVSHTFDLQSLSLPTVADLHAILEHPEEYGKNLYAVLFPPDTLARHALESRPNRLLLVPLQAELDTVPWEYTYGYYGTAGQSENFLVLACPFVRGLPSDQRINAPSPGESLHIIAVPSSPLNWTTETLPIESDWTLLQEVIQDVPRAITLERCRPPTLKRLRELVANQSGRLVHFIGHGDWDEKGAILCFEQDNADLDEVTAQRLMQRLQDTVFLVTLNACVTATPGPTTFSNLAATLVRHHVPYALGMRFSVFDTDARAFSRVLYSELARGSAVEQALLQARLTLADECPRRWALGVPVLYTSLNAPASGFICLEGIPTISTHQPHVDLAALPPPDGPFQGRLEELVALGSALTGNRRLQLLTIHGGGGQGKTALVRQAAERFAWAWPGGVWAISIETLPTRSIFVNNLAHFLGFDTSEIADPQEVENLVQQRLRERRTLLILDNAETVLDAVNRADPSALDLVAWLKQLLTTFATLLVTSRDLLAWPEESYLELGGLQSDEGAALFQQCAVPRAGETDRAALRELSEKLEGHPLSLRLLGRAFGSTAMPFSMLLATTEQQLIRAYDIYVGPEHRHYKLYACIEVSVRTLEPSLRAQLSGLWIFQAPFLASTAVAIFDPDMEETEQSYSPVRDALHHLWQRGLITRQVLVVRDASLTFYALLPTMRTYVEHLLEQTYERRILLERFGQAYFRLTQYISQELDRSGVVVTIAQQARKDLNRGLQAVTEENRSYYALLWSWLLNRLGNPSLGLEVLEQALEVAQETDQPLSSEILNRMALMYHAIGQPQKALELFEQALPITEKVGDLDRQATIIANMATAYSDVGQPQKALELYEQALPIIREVGDLDVQASILTNMATAYRDAGQPQKALELYEQALPITRQVGNLIGEATALANMATGYCDAGQPLKALELYEQALPIMREVGNLIGEAAALDNIANVYRDAGQTQKALELYEQALLITGEISDQMGEAAILANMANLYSGVGQPLKALELYEQALPIMREVGNRNREAFILNRIAEVYEETGQPQKALELYEQALHITREISDRNNEATILTHMAVGYREIGQPLKALELFEQALPIMKEVDNLVGEVASLINMAVGYREIGQPLKALELFEQALPIIREVGDLDVQASILTNMAEMYYTIGQPQKALELYEQALPITRELGDLTGEATALANMATMYSDAGQLQKALELYEQALPIMREVGNLIGEAVALINMAAGYRAIGQPQKALELYEQTLPITREISDRNKEATTLNSMATVYKDIVQPQKALELYEQVLPIIREISDRNKEATTLINMAGVYHAIGQPEKALELYGRVLSITREVGDLDTQTTILTDMAIVYREGGQPQKALKAYEQALSITREKNDRAGEATMLGNLSHLLYKHLHRPADAVTFLEQALTLLRSNDLPQDTTNNAIEDLEQLLNTIRSSVPLREGEHHSKLSVAQIQNTIDNTILAMTVMSESRAEWREHICQLLSYAQQQRADWQIEVDLCLAIIALLDGERSMLPTEHPYASTLASIQEGITKGGLLHVSVTDDVMHAIREFVDAVDWAATRQVVETRQELLFQLEVEAVFVQGIEQARLAGEEHRAKLLETHLAVLQACKRDGIEQVFAFLISQDEAQQHKFVAQLVSRSISALRAIQRSLARVWRRGPVLATSSENPNLAGTASDPGKDQKNPKEV